MLNFDSLRSSIGNRYNKVVEIKWQLKNNEWIWTGGTIGRQKRKKSSEFGKRADAVKTDAAIFDKHEPGNERK